MRRVGHQPIKWWHQIKRKGNQVTDTQLLQFQKRLTILLLLTLLILNA